MKINKDNILEEDKELAVQLLNNLRAGNRVLGNPGRGLEITLRDLEEKRDSVSLTKLQWGLKDKELEENIAKLKAGIEGEKNLADFLSQLLKYNDDLDGIIAYASLSQEQENNDKDYIPDSDFVLIRNDNLLIVDAKNVSTNPKVPIHIVGNDIITDTDKPKPILEGVHSSVRVWKNFFEKNGVTFNNIKNVVCIVNKSGAYTTESVDTDMELIHIAQLNDYLMNWYQVPSGNDFVRLADLVLLAKCEIRKEKSGLDLSYMKKAFKI